ncbi:hypothetical protein Pint_23442 [Pistacia integerrima]|uniref:Uncharacterized protein n=1 Tax=Pistacia integerrima TaxID=434235 RepID=A0ACC0YKD2_9ROSI|nr:hypothetical protein Pint_23442 [Pistacia integerrima]
MTKKCKHIPPQNFIIKKCKQSSTRTTNKILPELQTKLHHIHQYEKQYMEEIKLKAKEIKDDQVKPTPVVGDTDKSEVTGKSLKSKTSSTEQDLDTFLLGDLEDSDGGPDDGDASFDDDFDKIGNSDVEDEKRPEKADATDS